MAPLRRLSPADLTNLAVEAADTPMHQAVLAVLDARGLTDPRGHVLIGKVRAHVQARLGRVPELRQVLYRPGLFLGRPLWIDDPQFRIEEHVIAATLPPPGGEAAALAFAGGQMARLLDRSRPLWQIWMLDGYAPDRVALLIKMHHAIADGPAMVNMLAHVFDIEAPAPDGNGVPWVPAPRPSQGELLRDSLGTKAATVGRGFRRIAHPIVLARGAAMGISSVAEEIRQGRGTPRTSLNRPIQNPRRVAAMHVTLEDAKAIAHAEGVKLNDVFLYVVARALRRVLAARGEAVDGLTLRASMAVSRWSDRNTATTGNRAGTMIVPIPFGIDDPKEMLMAISAATARAKAKQLAVVATGLMVFLAQTGITRAFVRRQHMLNVMTTNLPGPPVPLYFAGARVRDPVALPPIAGNVTVSFAALSYDGGLTLSIVADATAWPDLDRLTAAMRASWRELTVTRLPAAREGEEGTSLTVTREPAVRVVP